MSTTHERTAEPIAAEGRVEVIGERALVRLPAGASAALPSRGQVAARLDLGAHRYDVVVEPDGRRGHWVALTPQQCRAASLSDGDPVVFSLTPITEWPEPDMPADLSSALEAAPDLAETWAGITPMARWEWVRWVGATRNPATRAKRVDVSIDKLRKGKRRPCCFDLSSCTDPELTRSGKLIDGA